MYVAILAALIAATLLATDEPAGSKAAECRELAQHEPNNGIAMYRAALCFEAIFDRASAVNAYHEAIKLGFQPDTASSRVASIFLVTGQKERALNTGQNELAFGQRRPAQDCAASEYRQADFLIGEWLVQSGGRPVGTSTVLPILHSCALLEKWTGIEDNSGLGFLFYDPMTHKWHQNRATDGKDPIEVSGHFEGAAMNFSGTSRLGTRRRRTIATLSPDHVRQLDETSPDGVTWAVLHDFLYVRLKPQLR